MPYYRRVGEVPPKRHIQFRRPDGGLFAEELVGEHGFSGPSSLLYHRHIPTAITGAEPVADEERICPNHPLLPRHLRTGELPEGGDMVGGRRLLLANEDVRISGARPTEPGPLYRNGAGDELVYIRTGALRLESVFGPLECRAGDYVVIPTSTTHRWSPLPGEPVQALVVEARGHIGPPPRYRTDTGQFREGSPYGERDLQGPEGLGDPGDGPAEVLVRNRNGLTRYTYRHHPFDVVGWDGYVYPYRFSIHDFEPITGLVHQPPPVHQTFAGPNFVVCSFVPRLFDYHPLAVPTPYNHANVDSDEVLYYCDGDFMSRKGSGIGAGSISLHPAGFIHGPQPGSVEASLGKPSTAELAVMIDTFRPLGLGPGAAECEDRDYPWSWARGEEPR